MARHKQAVLFAELAESRPPARPVNVASVPQRSPFRYPGGKTWFVPTFRDWIASLDPKPEILVEPFAGGGIISLTAIFENLAKKAVMVEIDEDVAAVWETIKKGGGARLADKIASFDLTRANLIDETSKVPNNVEEKAFHTILKNRTFHGGILAEGSGLIKHGENGKGIGSRWYPQTLSKRLKNLARLTDKMDFICGDGMEVMMKYASDPKVAYFIDPPYTAGGKKAGKRLYKHYNIDHEKLFSICKTLRGPFIITYDDAREVRELAKANGFQYSRIAMDNTHHATMFELVIGKDMSWMSDYNDEGE